MRKLTALFTIVALLVCMFAFAPTASAYELPNAQGERVVSGMYLAESNNYWISFELTCHNGWFDGTYGSDYVEAVMSSSPSLTSCAASIHVEATYIQEGSYTSDTDYESAAYLSTMTVSIYPNTDLLSYGNASFYVNHSTYGYASEYLSASCTTGTK